MRIRVLGIALATIPCFSHDYVFALTLTELESTGPSMMIRIRTRPGTACRPSSSRWPSCATWSAVYSRAPCASSPALSAVGRGQGEEHDVTKIRSLATPTSAENDAIQPLRGDRGSNPVRLQPIARDTAWLLSIVRESTM